MGRRHRETCVVAESPRDEPTAGGGRSADQAVGGSTPAGEVPPGPNGAPLAVYASFPVGGGPRGCIGNPFATMEAKLALATLCQRSRFEPVTQPPRDLTMKITLQPAGAVELWPVEH
jgi:cytochrome P450